MENENISAGELVLQTLLEQFTSIAHRKIEKALRNKEEKSLSKSLKQNEDCEFEQLLSCLNTAAEHSLPSLLAAMFDWHSLQHSNGVLAKRRSINAPLAKSQSLQHHYRPYSGEEDTIGVVNVAGQSSSLGPGVVPPSSGGASGSNSGGSSATLGVGSPLSSAGGSTALLPQQVCDVTATNNMTSSVNSNGQPISASPGSIAQPGQNLINNPSGTVSSTGVSTGVPSTMVSSVISSSGVGVSSPAGNSAASVNGAAAAVYLSLSEKEAIKEKKDLAVDYIFCQVLREILKQLPYHPGHADSVNLILNQAFLHFSYKEDLQGIHNGVSVNEVADMYAEVVGVLTQNRFSLVRQKFIKELKELRSKESSSFNNHSIISLIMGMKFFRVKMHPIEDFVACFTFLQELAHYFIEVKEKIIKHALAGLFVEILLPVGAAVKHEVNIPALKNFVDLLYTACIDMATKKKHSFALFPMLTCLLCVSQKQFFLINWPSFMTMCLAHLKNKDTKISHVSLQSLFRLLWVYIVRIKCEKHSDTQSKLQSIVNSLFPKGSKMVTPRDAPISIFVKIIQFIAQEKLDFAMKEIIFDLIGVNRPQKIIMPERMNIGLCAFLLIANGLQQKDDEIPMPQGLSGIVSGPGTMRSKQRPFHGSTLTDATATSLGIQPYLPQVRRAFDSILKLLDSQVCRPMLLTRQENANKEVDDVIPAERKPKLDLLKTCVASIPRILPEEMSKSELIELLSRLNLHIDEEVRTMAQQAMNNLVMEFPAWRQKTIHGFIQFIRKEISDTSPLQLDSCLKMLYHLLINWKLGLQKDGGAISAAKVERTALHEAEGFALVMLCHCRATSRRLAAHILREVGTIFNLIGFPKDDYTCCIDVMDKAAPLILEKVLPHLSPTEKNLLLSLQSVDFFTLAERNSASWIALSPLSEADKSTSGGGAAIQANPALEPWITCLSTILNSDNLLTTCPSALKYAWPIIYERITQLFTLIDPSAQINENRASSLLRASSSKKPTNERDLYLHLWHNYVVFSCCIAPSSTGVRVDCRRSKSSPEHAAYTDNIDKTYENKFPATSIVKANARDLIKLLVPLLRCEQTDLRNTVVNGLGCINPAAFRDALEDLQPLMKEAIDKKQENIRRRKRRDGLRVHLIRIFELMAQHDVFAHSEAGVVNQHRALIPQVVEYLEGMRHFLLPDNSEIQHLPEMRLHYCGLFKRLIRHMPKDKRAGLLSDQFRATHFALMTQWSGRFGQPFNVHRDRHQKDEVTELEMAACQGMSALLTCGPVFDAQNIIDDCPIFAWINILLNSGHDKAYLLAQETIVLLLDLNSDTQSLLEWVIDKCYTGSMRAVNACFQALVKTFNNCPEYPCDHVAIINVALLFTSCANVLLQEKALQLLQLLYHRFFVEQSMIWREAEDLGNSPIQEILWRCIPKCPQLEISKLLATNHPDLTMPIFSEVTQRFETATSHTRTNLLNYLTPWITNMELVDSLQSSLSSYLPHKNSSQSEESSLLDSWSTGHYQPLYKSSNRNRRNELNSQAEILSFDSHQLDCNPTLKSQGWGSKQATELILNNLFYMTVKFGEEHSYDLEKLWAALVRHRTGNLKIIIRYLIIITSLAPNELLSHAKRVVVYLGKERAEKLVDELMLELQTIDGLGFSVERTQTPPFFRLTSNRTKTNAFSSSDTENNPFLSPSEAMLAGFTSADPGKDPLGEGDLSYDKNTTDNTVIETNDANKDPRKDNQSPEPGEKENNPAFTRSAPPSLRAKFERVTSGEDEFEEHDIYATLRAPSHHPPVADNRSSSHHHKSLSQESKFSPITSPPPQPGILKPTTRRHRPCILDEITIPAMQPHPLPMPAYGGYFAPLQNYLPEQTLTWVAFYRSSVVLMFVNDLVVSRSLDIDWCPHLPLMLHCLFLGMDHSKKLVHEQCKQLLLNLFRTICPKLDQFRLASILLHSISQEYFLTVDGGPCQDVIRRCLSEEPTVSSGLQRTTSNFSLSSTTTLTPDTWYCKGLPKFDSTQSLQDVARAITEFILSRKGKPLWVWEDISVSRTQPMSAGNNSSLPVTTTALGGSGNASAFVSSGSSTNYPTGTASSGGSSGGNSGGGGPQSTGWNGGPLPNSLLKSAEELEKLVRYVCRVLSEGHDPASSYHLSTFIEDWCQLALNTGLSCSNRHYAERSLQVYRALRVPLTSSRLVQLINRLIETLAEQTDELQGYVTEILLTLESAVDHMNLEFRGVDVSKELHQSTPNLAHLSSPLPIHNVSVSSGQVILQRMEAHGKPHQPIKRQQPTPNSLIGPLPQSVGNSNQAATPSTVQASPNPSSPEHSSNQSTRNDSSRRRPDNSSNFANQPNSSNAGNKPRPRTMTEAEMSNKLYKSQLTRSRSNQSVDMLDLNEEDKVNILLKIFWVSMVLLDSDFEYEYQGALRLLDKLLNYINPERMDCREKLEKMLQQMNWVPAFPGVLNLLLKGLTNANLCEPTWRLLSRLVLSMRSPVVDPSQSLGFPITVLALLPHLVNNYEAPFNSCCKQAAENIARMCGQLSPDKLNNLATVMQLYSGGTFSKDSSQWTKCVVKYLLDAYSHLAGDLLEYLSKMISIGPAGIQGPLLQIVFCFLHSFDINSSSTKPQVQELVQLAVLRFADTNLWRQVTKLLHLVISKSAILPAPPPESLRYDIEVPLVPLPEAEAPRIELAGPILDFKYDMNRVQLVAEQLVLTNAPTSPKDSYFTENLEQSAWRRPWTCQTRVRERMVHLLSSYGTGCRVGIPKSPSETDRKKSMVKCLRITTDCFKKEVIFSQSTETLDRQLSMHSSSETTSTNDVSNADDLRLDDTSSVEQAQVFKDLDMYLDAQMQINFLDMDYGEDDRKPPWGVRSQSIAHHRNFHVTGEDEHTEENDAEFSRLDDSLCLNSFSLPVRYSVTTPSHRVSSSPQSPLSPTGPSLAGPQFSADERLFTPDQKRRSTVAAIDSEASLPSSQSHEKIGRLSMFSRKLHTPLTTKERSKSRGEHHRSSRSQAVAASRDDTSDEDSDGNELWQHDRRRLPGFNERTCVIKGRSLAALNNSDNHNSCGLKSSSEREPVGPGASSPDDEEDDDEESWHEEEEEEDISTRSDPQDASGLRRSEGKWESNPMKYLTLVRGRSYLESESAEQQWLEQLSEVAGKGSQMGSVSKWLPISLVHFVKAFREMCSRIRSLTSEANYYIAKVPLFKAITKDFSQIIESICTDTECPFIFIDSDLISENQKLAQRIKFAALQLYETYETFCLRKENAEECLDKIKRSVHLDRGEAFSDKNVDQSRLALCRQLHKLHTHLLMLFESHNKMVESLVAAIGGLTMVTNVSDIVGELSHALNRHLVLPDSELVPGSEASPGVKSFTSDLKWESKKAVEDILYHNMAERNYSSAVYIWRKAKRTTPYYRVYGDSDELFTLLNIFCSAYARDNSNLFVYLEAARNPNDVCAEVMDTLLQMYSSVTNLEKQEGDNKISHAETGDASDL